jgi:TonB family protein
MVATLMLLLALQSNLGSAVTPSENPVFAPIYIEACTPQAPRQTINYPPQLVGTDVFGQVELVLFLNPCGQVRHVIISRSSGVPDLDVAAVESAKTWVISPGLAKLQPGRGGLVRLPIQFAGESEP